MLRTLGIVHVPPSTMPADAAGSWTPFARRRLAGTSLVEWVVRRVTECARLDGVAVLAAGEEELEELRRLTPNDVQVLCGSGDDPLARIVSAVKPLSPRALVHFRLHYPLVDPALTDGLIAFAESRTTLDYATYASRMRGRNLWTRVGAFGEWCRFETLEMVDRLAVDELDRHAFTRFLYTNPRQFQLGFKWLPAELDRDDLRFVVRGEEDWEHMRDLVEALDGESWDSLTLAGLLQFQPEIRSRMARLNEHDEALAAALTW